MPALRGLTRFSNPCWRRGQFVTLAFALAFAGSKDGSCDAGDGSIGCGGQATSPLRWRTLPYGSLENKMLEYGGDLAAVKFYDAGFELAVEDDTWDLLFTHNDMVKELAKLSLPQRARRRLVNHCGYYKAAGQKCLFAEHVQTVEHAYGSDDMKQWRHLPTFSINDQGKEWKREALNNPTVHWVVKGCSSGMSDDVRIVRGGDEKGIDAAVDTPAVAQQFISNPWLWDNSKLHIRAYVLVTSWLPPRVFIYEDGIVLRSKSHHDPSDPRDDDLFSRHGETVEVLHLSMLWAKLGLNASAIAKANLNSILPELFSTALEESFGDFGAFRIDRSFDCFDLFGVDVVFTEDLAPYVLEVNAGPNLWGDDLPVLWSVKGMLIRHIAEWAKRIIQHEGPLSIADEKTIENATLVSFTRIV